YTGIVLPLALSRSVICRPRRIVLRLEPNRHALQEASLIGPQRVPFRIVEQHVDRRVLEAWVQPILCIFVPTLIKKPPDRPSEAVHYAPFKRSIDFTGRYYNRTGIQGLQERHKGRSSTNLESSKVELADRLGHINLHRNVVAIDGENACIQLFEMQ